jgi:hypothetical protein
MVNFPFQISFSTGLAFPKLLWGFHSQGLSGLLAIPYTRPPSGYQLGLWAAVCRSPTPLRSWIPQTLWPGLPNRWTSNWVRRLEGGRRFKILNHRHPWLSAVAAPTKAQTPVRWLLTQALESLALTLCSCTQMLPAFARSVTVSLSLSHTAHVLNSPCWLSWTVSPVSLRTLPISQALRCLITHRR